MEVRTFKLVIEYDGTSFFGWQRQRDQITVQGEIEGLLSRILNQPIQISGSGRTDAGVHAYGQVASFKAKTALTESDIKRGLNSLLKRPVVIHSCTEEDLQFHAQYSARSKEYHYQILNRDDPIGVGRDYVWHIKKPLNIEIMRKCCNLLLGEQDFKSFENTGSPRSSTIRTVFRADCIQPETDKIIIQVCASGFLKYMVRNIVGTLVDAGLNRIDSDRFQQILESRDRKMAGPTAPAKGLFLYQVNY